MQKYYKPSLIFFYGQDVTSHFISYLSLIDKI